MYLDLLAPDGAGSYYDIYGSDGVLKLISNQSEAAFDFGSNIIYTVNFTDDMSINRRANYESYGK